MKVFSNRRILLLSAISFALCPVRQSLGAAKKVAAHASQELAALEQSFGGRLGVFALNTANGAVLAHRSSERFPLCSTFKVTAAAGLLNKSEQVKGLMQQLVRYDRADLVEYSPVTEKHLANGMSFAELCAAAIQYSDNTAGNLLIKELGGPEAVTAFARSIGDTQFRLDRWETALNTAIPGDVRDTTTPESMGRSLQRLVLGNVLSPDHRDRLREWLSGNTTGAARIRAGIPADWIAGDKTGTGDYGTANDIAVLWPPSRKPVVLAIYTTQSQKEARAQSDVIASATRIVVDWLDRP